mgnify:CR=1 FL=1
MAEVLIDSGFVSEAAVRAIEEDPQGRPTGVRVLAAVGRIRQGRTVADLEQRADPPPPPPESTFTEKLAHRTAGLAGRTRYKLRQQTIEPAFGVVKAVLGFRRFSLRCLAQASLEWTLVTFAYNLKRLHPRRSAPTRLNARSHPRGRPEKNALRAKPPRPPPSFAVTTAIFGGSVLIQSGAFPMSDRLLGRGAIQ